MQLNEILKPIWMAPLQGYTDIEYVSSFHQIIGGVERFYRPFVKREKGNLRRKDLRQLSFLKGDSPVCIPQILPRHLEDAQEMVNVIASFGYQEIDINMGCPFVPVVKRGAGAGLLVSLEAVTSVLRVIELFPEIRFSVKLRTGWESSQEILELLPILNSMQLTHVTLHPRLGIDQYRGDVDLDLFRVVYQTIEHPLVYNGDLITMEDIINISTLFPKLRAIMVGRGLLANPFLLNKKECDGKKDKIEQLLLFHTTLFEKYQLRLEGDAQLLNKMKTTWDYLAPNLNKKWIKKIKKSRTLDAYLKTVAFFKEENNSSIIF